jgi:hydroxyethylthiazole kinase-like uncharacterized protein yjeF
MARLVSFAQARELDRISQERYSIPGDILMENAGLRLWDYLAKMVPSGKNLLFAVGRGNNGGDALVMARQAWVSGRRNLQIYLPAEPSTPSAQQNLDSCLALGIPLSRNIEELGPAAILIDGLFGVGLCSPLENRGKEKGNWINILRELNERFSSSEHEIWSIDCPSGLYGFEDQDHRDGLRASGEPPGIPVLRADHTLSIQWDKEEFYNPWARQFCGEIHTLPIGFPLELEDEVFLKAQIFCAPRVSRQWQSADYKNRRGHLLVVGGSENTLGAPFLSGTGASSAGAGLVSVAVPMKTEPRFDQQPPNLMLHFQETLREQDPKTYQAHGSGPRGTPEDGSFWEWFADWTREGYPLIIDAQGLREWTRIKEHFCGDYAQVLLTPHPGEFSGLTNLDSQIIQRQAIAICRDFSQREGVMVLFKSADPTLICPDGRTTVIPGQNPRMGTAGNGDFFVRHPGSPADERFYSG